MSTETLLSILKDLRYCCDLALISSRWILGSRLRSISCRRFISSSFSFVRRLCCSHSWRKEKQNCLISTPVSPENGVSRKVIIMCQTMYTRLKHRVECFIIERSRITLTSDSFSISKNKKWADKNCANKFLWMKRVWNYYWIFFLTNERYTTSKRKLSPAVKIDVCHLPVNVILNSSKPFQKMIVKESVRKRNEDIVILIDPNTSQCTISVVPSKRRNNAYRNLSLKFAKFHVKVVIIHHFSITTEDYAKAYQEAWSLCWRQVRHNNM